MRLGLCSLLHTSRIGGVLKDLWVLLELTLSHKFDLLLEYDNLLQLPFDQLFELKDLLVSLFSP